MKFLWEQDMIKSSDPFENGCSPLHCDNWVSIAVTRWTRST